MEALTLATRECRRIQSNKTTVKTSGPHPNHNLSTHNLSSSMVQILAVTKVLVFLSTHKQVHLFWLNGMKKWLTSIIALYTKPSHYCLTQNTVFVCAWPNVPQRYERPS